MSFLAQLSEYWSGALDSGILSTFSASELLIIFFFLRKFFIPKTNHPALLFASYNNSYA